MGHGEIGLLSPSRPSTGLLNVVLLPFGAESVCVVRLPCAVWGAEVHPQSLPSRFQEHLTPTLMWG